MVRIYCKNTDTSLDFQEGTSLLEILPAFKLDNPYPILAAKVNNVVEGLKFKVYNNRDVEFLDYRTYGGRGVYCRSLCFLLSKATLDLFPASKITMRRPISKGYYCELSKADGTALTIEDVSAISARMKEIADAATPFYRHEVRSEDAIALLHKLDYQDKAKLLETSGETY
ncbi:MAG: nucleoside kinase, partial [Bacteroidales bacterium]|nr:nucleoside kinase [Bacteroidales bacterium]